MFPNKILLCVDSEEHFAACKVEAGWIARHLNCGLVMYHAAPERWMDAGPSLEDTHVDEDWLIPLVDDPALVNIEVETLSTSGFSPLIDSILSAARETGCDMVMIPTHARSGLDHMILGSVAERVLRSCKIPVMTLDLGKMPTTQSDAAFDRVICPIDFSKKAEDAMHQGAQIAQQLSVGVTIVHAIDDYFAAAYPIDGIPSLDVYLPSLISEVSAKVQRMSDKLTQSFGIESDHWVESASLTSSMIEVAKKHANPLVVMATGGRDSLGDHILGSRTERIVRSVHVPVLALPNTEFN